MIQYYLALSEDSASFNTPINANVIQFETRDEVLLRRFNTPINANVIQSVISDLPQGTSFNTPINANVIQ